MNQIKGILKWGEMSFDLSYGDEDLSAYYNDIFRPKQGTAASRLTDNLRYENTGSQGSVRVSVQDLKELINFYKSFNEEESKRRMDLDLRSDSEIINISDGLERERRIKEKMNFKDLMK